MKIKLIVVGKTKSKFLVEGEKVYSERLKHYCKFTEFIIPNVKNSSKLSTLVLKNNEGKSLLSAINNSAEVILLDENGSSFSSFEFSKFLNKKLLSTNKELVFVVGGAFGFSGEVYNRADLKLSLSKMTFSHQMIRLIFKEQLYRAFTILKGEKYHHE
tara:strand:+ start:1019 stop:1492 length:474 start_codon:yes stop_codon:yes gene_type:complete